MRPWFTTEPLAPDTWGISEYRHWEETHCYLLIGQDHALDVPPALPAQMRDALRQLKREGKLRHGAGVFQYDSWGIRL